MRIPLTIALLATAAAPAAAASQPPVYFSSFVWAVMENHSTTDALKLASERYLVAHGATFKSYRAITHPSGPNYRVLASGKTWTQRETYERAVPTVATELAAVGIPTIDWYVGGKPDLKHDPYADLKSPIKVEPRGPFDPDKLPPNAQVYLGYDDLNNAHDGPMSAVDRNIEALTRAVDRSKWFSTPDATGRYPVLMVTWDESFTATNEILTVFYGHGVKPGYVSQTPANHYNLCRTLTDNWHLAPLGDAAKARPITDIWQ